ncbi:curli production assembly/transport component CsgE [Fluviicoccus keumensis]|uniref:Curli production assembly/transport component CsgE n=1 Tax=Fluviicoccus keumensis TaxID=1435465 RepID=A0A4Q7ZA45_9GAMM|nr:CsgE family curli-type amyloid fiber assembly protein [Fluviicoccus keumensis]RZU46954.1 curli production assembly/transport component CsgE [Fluviicoccus keumensis]
MRRIRWLALLPVLLAGQAGAGDDLGLGGLLLNETRTFAGQAFYNAFTETWRALDPAGQYSLVISERPSARTGSQITVRYGTEEVYRQFIHFSAERAARAGRAAPGPVFDHIASGEVDELFVNPDLAPDEIRLK